MGQILVGTGGWDYFSIPSGDPLRAYSTGYNFVEVNSTYYRMPSMSSVGSWRMRVPPSFEFAIRCWRPLVEKYKLRLTEPVDEAIGSIEQICRRVRATILAVLIPQGVIDSQDIDDRLQAFLSTVRLGKTRVAFEFRGERPS